MPMEAYEGMSGSPTTPTPISTSDSSIAGLRPTRSPKRPITSAPSGRVRKPTPKVASEANRLAAAEVEGKNVRPIWTAKNA
jgi:hypothetical protein